MVSALPALRSPTSAILHRFNNEFGIERDLSRYENIKSSETFSSASHSYLNELQIDHFIPAKVALLLKNNFHDIPFVTFTTRSLIYDLKHEQKIGEKSFQLLHQKIEQKKFEEVFKFLYVVMLYSKIAEHHNFNTLDHSFHFESCVNYSDKLTQLPHYQLQKEETSLHNRYRTNFLKNWLTSITNHPSYSEEVKHQAFTLIAPLEQNSSQFQSEFFNLLKKLENGPFLEKFCWQELKKELSSTPQSKFIDQLYLKLKTENYYKGCFSRVKKLRENLEIASNEELEHLSEKCKRAFNGCAYLLGDSKNMPSFSPTKYSAILGKIRTEWVAINNIYNRASSQFSHHLCTCHSQTPATQNQLAEWPFNTHSLISAKPMNPVSLDQVREKGIDIEMYRKHQNQTIAVMGCDWGGGHASVTGGLSDYFSEKGMHTVNVNLPELLMPEDPIRSHFITRLLGKKWSVGSVFNHLMHNKAFGFINFLRWISGKKFHFATEENKIKSILQQLLKINPQAVVMTYSAHTEPLREACKILGIPFLNIATDVDTTVSTRTSAPDYAHFKTSMPFNEAECLNPLLQVTTPEQRFVSGPPVRMAFSKTRTIEDIRLLKQKWGIEQNKKVVIITSGKNGAHSHYPEILAKKYKNCREQDIPIHMIVLCGKGNKKHLKHLERNIAPHTKLQMRALESANESQMEELMSMAAYGGCLVGKAGGATLFEAFTKGTRILVDKVDPHWFKQGFKHFFIVLLEMFMRRIGFPSQLPWEQINSEFARRNGISQTFHTEEAFLPKLEELLNNDNNPVSLNIEVKKFGEEVTKVMEEMLTKAQYSLDSSSARTIHRHLVKPID